MSTVGKPFRLRSSTGARLEVGLLAISASIVIGTVAEQLLMGLSSLPLWANLLITVLSSSLVGVTIFFSMSSAHLKVGVNHLDGLVWPRHIRMGLVAVPILAVGVSALLHRCRSGSSTTSGPVVSAAMLKRAKEVRDTPNASATDRGLANVVTLAGTHADNFAPVPAGPGAGPGGSSAGPAVPTSGPSTSSQSGGQPGWPIAGPIVYFDKNEKDEIRERNQSVARQNPGKPTALIIAGMLFPPGAPIFAALGFGGDDISTQTTLDIIHGAAVSGGRIDEGEARKVLTQMTPQQRAAYIAKLVEGLSQTDPPNKIPADSIEKVDQQLHVIANELDKQVLNDFKTVVDQIDQKGSVAIVEDIRRIAVGAIGATPSNKSLAELEFALRQDQKCWSIVAQKWETVKGLLQPHDRATTQP